MLRIPHSEEYISHAVFVVSLQSHELTWIILPCPLPAAPHHNLPQPAFRVLIHSVHQPGLGLPASGTGCWPLGGHDLTTEPRGSAAQRAGQVPYEGEHPATTEAPDNKGGWLLWSLSKAASVAHTVVDLYLGVDITALGII